MTAGAIVGTAAAPLLRADMTPRLFDGFKSQKIQTTGATINIVMGGRGAPLLATARESGNARHVAQGCAASG